MAWAETNRQHFVRKSSGYASDLTDREWGLVTPSMAEARRLCRPNSLLDRQTPDQAYFNALAPMMVAASSRRKST